MDLSGADDSEMSCPLCLEDMDSTDRKFQPCHCGYQICLWCWHHIMEMAKKDSLEGRCPACRSPYDKEKIVSGPSTERDELPESGAEKKQKFGKGRSKATAGGGLGGGTGGPPVTGVDARKHLSNVRVVQRNLVYVVGMPYSLADEETLERKEYFGQYGRILKIAVSRSNSAISNASATMHGPTANVYVTFVREDDAVRCIHAVDGCMFEGRILRACFGTTKYCNAWLKNMVCPNPDCLYLHEVGTQEDSFTKEEMLHRYNTAASTAGGPVTSLGPGINPASSKHHSQYDSGPPVNRRAANGLPPPLDGYLMDRHASLASSMGPSVAGAGPGRSNPSNGPPAGNTGKGVTAGTTASGAGTGGGGILPPAASWGAKGASAAGKLILSAPRPYGAVTAGGAPQSAQGLLLANGGMGTVGSAPASAAPSATPLWPAPSAASGPYASSPPTSIHPGGGTSGSLGAGRAAGQQSHLLSSSAQQFKPSAAVLSGRVIQASAHAPPVFGSAGGSMGAVGPTVSTGPSSSAAALGPGPARGSVGDRLRKSPPSPFQHSPPPAGNGGAVPGGAPPATAAPQREAFGNGVPASAGAENPLRPQARHDPWGQGAPPVPPAATAGSSSAAPAAASSLAAGGEGAEGGAGQPTQGQRLSDVVSGSAAAVLRESSASLGSGAPPVPPGIAALPVPGAGASSPAAKASALPTRSKSRLVVLGHTSTASPKAGLPTPAAGTSVGAGETPAVSGRESEAASQAKGQLPPSKASSGSNGAASLAVPPGFGLATAAASSGRSLEDGARPGAGASSASQGDMASFLGESPPAESRPLDGSAQIGGDAAEEASLKAWQSAAGQPHKSQSESDLSLGALPGAVGPGSASLVARMAEVARQLKQRRLQGVGGSGGSGGGGPPPAPGAEEWRLMEGVALGSKEEEWRLIQGILEMPRQAAELGSRRSQGGHGRNGGWGAAVGTEAAAEAAAEEEAEFSWDASWLAAAAISTSLKARGGSVSAQDIQPDAAAAAAAAMLATASASPKDPLAGWLLDTLASGGSTSLPPSSARPLPGAVASFAFAPLSQALPPSSQRQSRFSFARGPNGMAGNHRGKGLSGVSFTQVGALAGEAQGLAPGTTGTGADVPGNGRVLGLAAPPGFGMRPGMSSLSAQAEGGRSGAGTLSAPPGFPVQPRALAKAAPGADPAGRASGGSSFLSGSTGSASTPADAEIETAAVLAEEAATRALGEGAASSLVGARWEMGAGAGLGGPPAASGAPMSAFLSSAFAAGGEASAFGGAAGSSALGMRGQSLAPGQASWGFGSALGAQMAPSAWAAGDSSLGASLGATGAADSANGFLLPGFAQSAASQHLLGMFQSSGTRPSDSFGGGQAPGSVSSTLGQAGAWMSSGVPLGTGRAATGSSALGSSLGVGGDALSSAPVAARGSGNAMQPQQSGATKLAPSTVTSSPQLQPNGFRGGDDALSKETSSSSAALEPWQLLPDDSSVDSAVATPSLGLRGLGTSRLPALLARGVSNGPHASAESAEGSSLAMKATSRRLGGRYGFGLEPEEGDA